MYGNCKKCGQRFGHDGEKFLKPCKRIKKEQQKIINKLAKKKYS